MFFCRSRMELFSDFFNKFDIIDKHVYCCRKRTKELINVKHSFVKLNLHDNLDNKINFYLALLYCELIFGQKPYLLNCSKKHSQSKSYVTMLHLRRMSLVNFWELNLKYMLLNNSTCQLSKKFIYVNKTLTLNQQEFERINLKPNLLIMLFFLNLSSKLYLSLSLNGWIFNCASLKEVQPWIFLI